MVYLTRSLILGATLLGLTACASVEPREARPNAEPIRSVIDAAMDSDVVIVGETHDNPHHHQLQAEIAAAINAGGLAFEMVPESAEEAVNAARRNGVTREALGALLEWSDSGWPDWGMYAPIFEAVPEAYVAGGEIDREMARKARADGADSVFADADRFGLSEPLPEELHASLVQELIDSHCGMIPRHVAVSMAETQRLRDASFAAAALRALKKGGAPVVVITGSGHARLDRGIPYYLERAAPDLKIVSVDLTEQHGETIGHYDHVIRTDAVERDDPCAAFIGAGKG